MPHQVTCIISSPYVNSNWSYGLETAKLSFDLCDLDLWPLTLTFCMDIISVNGNISWKFYDDTMTGTLWQGSHKNLRKNSMIFPWLLQAKIQISRQKKSQYLFLRPMYQFVDRQTQTHTHTQTHTWFDQGQPTIQLILLVIELIQEVKTTLVLISLKWVTDFPINIWKNDIEFSFPYRLYI